MLDEEGNEVRRELTGPWAEARAALEAAASDLMEAATDGLGTMKLEPTKTALGERLVGRDYVRCMIQRRAAKALDGCVERVRVARRYLDMGEPAMAASELIAATAYYALGLLPQARDPEAPEADTWSAAVDDARTGATRDGPWVRALRTAAKQIRALHPILEGQDVKVPACVDPPALRRGPGRMQPVGLAAPRALERDASAFRDGLAKEREDEEQMRLAGKPVRPRRRT